MERKKNSRKKIRTKQEIEHEKNRIQRNKEKLKEQRKLKPVKTEVVFNEGEKIVVGNQVLYNNLHVRQLKYKSPQALKAKIEEYFDSVEIIDGETKKRPVTFAGLARFLGFSDRRSLIEYSNRDKYGDIIRDAILRIEESLEEKLHGHNVTGPIFILKNMGQMSWSDNIKTDMNVKFDPFIKLMESASE